MSSYRFLYHHHFFHIMSRIFLILLIIVSCTNSNSSASENDNTTKIPNNNNISTTKLTPIHFENKSIPFDLTTATTTTIGAHQHNQQSPNLKDSNLTELTESTEPQVLIKIPNEILADATLVNFTVTKHIGQTTKSIPRELLTTPVATTTTTTTTTPPPSVKFINRNTTKTNEYHLDNSTVVSSLNNEEDDTDSTTTSITIKSNEQLLLDDSQTEDNYVENLPTTTTEEYHFDLSSYTDEYKLNKSNDPINNNSNDNNNKYQLTTDSSNQAENKIITSSEEVNFSAEHTQEKSNYKNLDYEKKSYPKENFTTLSTEIGNKNYEVNFNQIVLTTPSTLDFDEIHKTYKNSDDTESTENGNTKSSYRQKSGRLVNINDDDDDRDNDNDDNDNANNDNVDFSKIKNNSTNEHNSTSYYNNAQIDDSKYDISTNEIHNRTNQDDGSNSTVIRDGDNDNDHASLVEMLNGTVVLINPKNGDNSNMNITIPNSAEVWALASMKNIEHNQIREGQYVNVTSTKDDLSTVPKSPSQNGTLVSKQLADWVEVMKHTEFTNSSFGNSDRINGTLPTLPTVKSSSKLDSSADSSNQENKIVSVQVSPEVLTPTTTKTPTPTTELPILFPKQAINFTTLKTDDHQRLNEDIEPINGKHLEKSMTKENSHQNEDEQLSSNVLINDHTNKHEATGSADNLFSLHNDKFNFHDFTTDKINQLETTFAPPQANNDHDNENDDDDHEDTDDDEDIVTTTIMPISTTDETNDDTTDFTENDLETTLKPQINLIKNTQSPIDLTTLTTSTSTSTPTTASPTTTVSTTTTTTSTTTTTTTTSTTTTPPPKIIITEIKITTTAPQIQIEETTLSNESSIINRHHEINDEHNSNEILPIHNNEISYPSKINSSNSVDKNVVIKNDDHDDHDGNNSNNINHNDDNDNDNDDNAHGGVGGDDDDSDGDDDNNDGDNDNSGIMFQPIIENTTSINLKNGENNDVSTEIPNTNSPAELGVTNEVEPTSDTVAIVGIAVGVCGAVCLIVLIAFIVIMRKRRKQLTYGQRCRPVGLDAYSLDNVSVYNSVRRKGALRQSKRAYANAAFDDPAFKSNLLTVSSLAKMVGKQLEIYKEFKELPTVTARIDEVPDGCEDKNRYANIVPLPETRVNLKQLNNDEKTEYINANFVKGPNDLTPYYIACQAPTENTIADFWRMIWEQNSRVIIMATDLIENGIEKCAEYIPPSVVLDNYRAFGDFQVTLKSRDVKDKYAVSVIHLQNTLTNTWRELNHLWYQWPLNDNTVPVDESTIISLLLETRNYLKISSIEQSVEQETNENGGGGGGDAEEVTSTTTTSSSATSTTVTTVNENGKIPNELKFKSLPRQQGPLTVHCSPGTGRTGTIIACDIALRSLDQPAHSVDIPQIVYSVRRGRASAVRTREQYEFIYKVALMYATKITGPINDS